MNDELKLVFKYCKINKLSVNMTKTNYMIFTSSRKKVNIHIPNINHVNELRFLGVFLDASLNWKSQIRHVNNKLAKNIGVLYKLRHYLNLTTLKQIYYAFIYPYLTYGVMSWGNTII